MTFVTLFLQTDMPCIYLVRAMCQLHFKTKISCLCQLGTKLCLITSGTCNFVQVTGQIATLKWGQPSIYFPIGDHVNVY